MNKTFEVALKNKMRFSFRGLISVEDLFDLSIDQLNSIYVNLSKQKKDKVEESLLQEETKEDKTLSLKMIIVKHIFTEKMEEKKARENEIADKLHNQKILGLIAEKQDESLKSMTVEELRDLVK